MKILGRGWQYTTYDLGNGRALKQYNSTALAYWVIFFDCFKSDNLSIFKIPAYHTWCKAMAHDSMQKVKSGALESWMMGNPKVLNDLDYEQDKLVSLHEHLNSLKITEAKIWVDKFVEFNKELVRRSLIDKNFNITKNFGIDKEGRVVLVDLGELYSSTEAVNEQRRKRLWAYPFSVKYILDKDVRAYYLEQMDKNFALET